MIHPRYTSRHKTPHKMKSTSIEAFNNIKPKIPTDHSIILGAMKKDEPMTYKEIGYSIYKKLLLSPDGKKRTKAFAWKYDPNKVSRRLCELVRLKKIKPVGVRKCTKAKSNCTTYVLV